MAITWVEDRITDDVTKLEESVGSIDTIHLARDYQFGVAPLEGQKSGAIIDQKGYIGTATDVALIGVGANNPSAAKLGDSEKLKAEQTVLPIGNALGLPGAPTVCTGVIHKEGQPGSEGFEIRARDVSVLDVLATEFPDSSVNNGRLSISDPDGIRILIEGGW